MAEKEELYVTKENKLTAKFPLREGVTLDVDVGFCAKKGDRVVEAFGHVSIYNVMSDNVAWKGIFENVAPLMQKSMVQNTAEIFKADAFKAVSRLTFAGLSPEQVAEETGLNAEAVEQHLRYHEFRTGESDDDPSYDE